MSKQTTQELQQIEKPVNEKKVEKLCKDALLQVTRIENRKRNVIIQLAQKLEDEAHVPRSSISATISKYLKDYVTPQYVSRCLNPDQRDSRKVRHNTGRKRKLDKERTVGIHEGNGNGDGNDVVHEIQQHVKSGNVNIKMLDKMYETKEKNKAISAFRIYFNNKLEAESFEELLN